MNEFDLAAKCCTAAGHINVTGFNIGKGDYIRIENTLGYAVYIPIEDLIAYLRAEGRIKEED